MTGGQDRHAGATSAVAQIFHASHGAASPSWWRPPTATCGDKAHPDGVLRAQDPGTTQPQQAPIMFQARKESISVERKPAVFGDMRGWIAALEAEGELQEIN